MPAIATNTSQVNDSTKSGYISYTETYYIDNSPDSEGNYVPPSGPFYYNGTTSAKITGSTVSSSGNVYANSKPVATNGDSTRESWQADPEPQPTHGGSITSVSPGRSGSGQGSITSGSSGVYINGKKVAYVGSNVNTHIGSTTTIKSGESNIIVSS